MASIHTESCPVWLGLWHCWGTFPQAGKGSADTGESCHTSVMYPHQFLRTMGEADRDLMTATELPYTVGLLPSVSKGQHMSSTHSYHSRQML